MAYRTTLAGECPLFSAWGRFEDGAPASRDRLRCDLVVQVPITPEITASYHPFRELMTFVMGRS